MMMMTIFKKGKKINIPTLSTSFQNFWLNRLICLFRKNGKKEKIENFFYYIFKFFKFFLPYSFIRMYCFLINYYAPSFKTHKYAKGSKIFFKRGFYKPLKNYLFARRTIKHSILNLRFDTFIETFIFNFFDLVINLPRNLKFLETYDQLFFDRIWHKNAKYGLFKKNFKMKPKHKKVHK